MKYVEIASVDIKENYKIVLLNPPLITCKNFSSKKRKQSRTVSLVSLTFFTSGTTVIIPYVRKYRYDVSGLYLKTTMKIIKILLSL